MHGRVELRDGLRRPLDAHRLAGQEQRQHRVVPRHLRRRGREGAGAHVARRGRLAVPRFADPREEHQRDDESRDERERDRPDDRRDAGVATRPQGEAPHRPGGPRVHAHAAPDASQVLRHVVRRRVAARGTLLERSRDDDLEVPGQPRVLAAERRGLRREHLAEQARDAWARERRLERQRLVERRAERVDVGAAVDGAVRAADLLGRHVRRRAHGTPVRVMRVSSLAASPWTRPKSSTTARPPASSITFAGLHVAVDEPRLVRGVERERDLLGDGEPAVGFAGSRLPLLDGTPLALQRLRERLALHVLERDPGPRPPSGPTSSTRQIPGCTTRETACASRRKRAIGPGSVARDQLERGAPTGRLVSAR